MGYSIHYGDQPDKIVQKGKSHHRRRWLTVCFFFLFLLYVHYFRAVRREMLIDIVFPQRFASAREAAAYFVEDMKQGENIRDALTDFFRVILDYGRVF